MRGGSELEVGGRKLTVTNLDKVLFPKVGFTKGQVIDYYIRISGVLLAHLKDRPVTLKRYPNGIHGDYFYEKEAPRFTPAWVEKARVWRVSGQSQINYVLINDLPSLVWSANLANLEMHTFLAKAPKVEQPTMLVFDLDPGEPAGVLECARVALWLKDILAQFGLQTWIKSSGSKGLHFYVPLNTPVTYETTQPIALALAQHLERQHPDLVISEMAKEKRAGKVFIDWSQNTAHKTTVCVYSLRAKREEPFISMPLTWEQVQKAFDSNDQSSFYVSPEEAIARCKELGDQFAPVLQLKQRLPANLLTGVRNLKTPKPTHSKAAHGDLSIKAYRAKRDFTQTKEPPPKVEKPNAPERERMFVIQKHAASHLHYDFRLEMGGVLKSWAVPKGPPYERNEKRLAMQVEDHPMEYARFEGTIPAGNYGAGTVMVWDIGTYELMDGNLGEGKLHFRLTGKKLQGEWILVQSSREGDKRPWFLIKGGASMPRLSANKDDSSALTGRSLAEIGEANDAQWASNRSQTPTTRSTRGLARPTAKPAPVLPKGLPRAQSKFYEPMQPKLVAQVPWGDGWLHEIKLDGYRAIAIKKAGKVAIRSRNNKPLPYPAITKALQGISAKSAVLDGEVVALGPDGKPTFEALQGQSGDNKAHRLQYFVFDLLNYDGQDLRGLPLAQRRQLLQQVLNEASDPIHFSASLQAPSADDLIDVVREQGLEGIVSKKSDSTYESGARTGAWVKYRADCEQEFVVGGYRPGRHRGDFDALIVGYYEDGKLKYAGKVKDGFTSRAKQFITDAATKLKSPRTPFVELPTGRGGRWGLGLTDDDLRQMVWLKPKLVVQVRFVEWTRSGLLRHPRFKGVRQDKVARQVVREEA